VQHGQL